MDYQLKPIGKTCAGTGVELVPGETCYSAAVEQDGKLIRLDYRQEAWQGPPEGTLGYWKCVVPDAAAQVKPLDPDALLRYFEQLCEETNPAQQKLAWILSLLLVQKRRLQIDGSRSDGDIEYIRLTGSKGEGPYEVREQELADEEVETLQRELNTHLAAECT